jgi:hypothetical protein
MTSAPNFRMEDKRYWRSCKQKNIAMASVGSEIMNNWLAMANSNIDRI